MWHWGRQRADDVARRAPQQPRKVYEQPDFRHFLRLERKRAEHRGRSLVLVLVEMTPVPRSRRTAAAAHETVFAALETCVRESDFLGWFETNRIAGAALIQGDAAPSAEICRVIGRRVDARLKDGLPAGVGTEVRVLMLAAGSEEQRG